MKEHASMDVNSRLVLSTLLSKASVHDTNYFQATVLKGIQGKNLPNKVHVDKGTAGTGTRSLSLTGIKDGIMRKDSGERPSHRHRDQTQQKIPVLRYKIERYFSLSHLHQGVGRAQCC